VCVCEVEVGGMERLKFKMYMELFHLCGDGESSGALSCIGVSKPGIQDHRVMYVMEST
jgi:hypothetical protein